MDNLPVDSEVRLSSEAVRKAAALSVARFTMFLTWAITIFLVRALTFWNKTPPGWQRYFILCSEVSRYIMTVAQEHSILTYSCQYKAVSTWGSPLDGDKPSITGRVWETPMQDEFRTWIWDALGKQWHAKMIFWCVEFCWPCLFRIWPTFMGGARIGPTMFANFSSPPQSAYELIAGEGRNPVQIMLQVSEEKLTRTEPCYSVRFTNVPAILVESMDIALRGKTLYRVNMAVVFLFSTTGLIAPILFAMWHPLPAARLYWLLEQIAVNLTKYYDVWDNPVNTKFAARLETAGWS